jgi:hypothetical protein
MTILELVQKHVQLHKSGSNMVGPCPKCGGSHETTRFVVNLAKDFAQCYSCGGNWDAVRFLKDIEGHTCPEAHRQAGQECDFHQCPVFDKCSLGRGEVKPRRDTRSTPQIPAASAHAFTPAAADSPADVWQKHAGDYVELCHRRLLESAEQLAYLAGRGLPLEAVQKYRLGWIPQIEFKKRAAWGLPDKHNEKENRATTSMAFPQGILLPWIVEGRVHRLRLRKHIVTGPTDPRYLWIDGSGSDIICLNHAAPAHCVVESDLDGLLLDWLAGDIIGAIPLGSCSTKPKATVMTLLRSSLRIMVALDYDHEQRDEKLHAPGARAAHWWFKEFPETAKRWPVPQGKDPGEAFAAGSDLRAWIIQGLPIALQARHLKTAAGTPVAETAPVAVEAGTGAAPAERPATVQVFTARDGRTVHITDDPAEYVALVTAGKIVFASEEINFVRLSGASLEQTARFLDAKQIFPGARLVAADPDFIRTETTRPQYQGKHTSIPEGKP